MNPPQTWSDSPIPEQIRTMNDTPTPRTDAELFLSRGMGMVPTLPKEAVRAVFSRTLERELAAVTAQRDTLAEALQKLADCYWSISLPDRMDAVRTIARDALQSLTPNDQVEARREKTPPQQ